MSDVADPAASRTHGNDATNSTTGTSVGINETHVIHSIDDDGVYRVSDLSRFIAKRNDNGNDSGHGGEERQQHRRDSVLPSFPSIKQKTNETIYGASVPPSLYDRDTNNSQQPIRPGSIDKSPKGSVDERIRPLVDLINQWVS